MMQTTIFRLLHMGENSRVGRKPQINKQIKLFSAISKFSITIVRNMERLSKSVLYPNKLP